MVFIEFFIRMYRYPTYQVFLTAVLSLVLTIILTPLWIRILKRRNVGQFVREDGPEKHLEKQGTPTMGGLLIILVVLLSFGVMGWVRVFRTPGEFEFGRLLTEPSILVMAVMIACGLIGLVDDYLGVIKERSLGLRARNKLITQLVIAIGLGWAALNYQHLSTNVSLPMLGVAVPFGLLYYPFLYLIITATTSSVNFTDGLDGLAGGTVAIVMIAYAGIAFRQNHLDLALICAAVAGACIGFLWYNAYPAEIFMGDTGSLALGGGIAAMAVLTKTELFLPLIGGIYVIETLSVIIQIFFFRCFNRRRVFKMAPIHHHFEMLGWSETKVMVRFWIITGILAGLGFALYFISHGRTGS